MRNQYISESIVAIIGNRNSEISKRKKKTEKEMEV